MKQATTPDIEGLIRTSPWFGDLPSALIERLVKASHLKQLNKNEYLFSAGEQTSDIFCLYSGRIRLSTGDSEGQIFAITDLEPDYWFGEAALVHSKQRIIGAEAKEPSSLVSLPRNIVLDVANQHPLIYRALFHEHVKRTRALYELLNGMLFYPLRSRLAGRILDMARENGEQTPEGTFLNVKLNQNDLARLCFGSRQSINKILREWYALDIVVMHEQRYLIKDIDSLKKEVADYTDNLFER